MRIKDKKLQQISNMITQKNIFQDCEGFKRKIENFQREIEKVGEKAIGSVGKQSLDSSRLLKCQTKESKSSFSKMDSLSSQENTERNSELSLKEASQSKTNKLLSSSILAKEKKSIKEENARLLSSSRINEILNSMQKIKENQENSSKPNGQSNVLKKLDLNVKGFQNKNSLN